MFPIRDHNPSRRTPYVTVGLILANVAIFLMSWQAIADQAIVFRLYDAYALVPAKITSGFGWQGFVTSAFLHAELLHLAGNMLFLWIFGDNLEDQMGHLLFAVFYLLCAVMAGLAQVASDPFSRVPVIGASGAVAGVMGGYLLLYPKSRIDVFFFFVIFFKIIPIPAWLVLGVWFGLQLFNGAATLGGVGGVAYWAHAGGFAAGFLLTVPLWLKLGASNYWRSSDGHPPHADAKYKYSQSRVPVVRRRPR